jgi:hypothetical protein
LLQNKHLFSNFDIYQTYAAPAHTTKGLIIYCLNGAKYIWSKFMAGHARHAFDANALFAWRLFREPFIDSLRGDAACASESGRAANIFGGLLNGGFVCFHDSLNHRLNSYATAIKPING